MRRLITQGGTFWSFDGIVFCDESINMQTGVIARSKCESDDLDEKPQVGGMYDLSSEARGSRS